ncbi:DUF3306 domain-containing protein [Alphaproteobacteria bacterium GH1-50]|uniref:DUF3306 domain-containing protein n=1 Tax=Kangsaoukella pontilimi TaxID=2691042 RepID=A0A7C9MDA5_9RHOB|nr:DUF3306 domain-containing protein [Kangsaoukella pontilimi]MXQ06336.1 DUF3306 domain-containing protein [Kangsaoukella pontilimi]
MSGDDDSLLSRWSKRKRAVAEEARVEEKPMPEAVGSDDAAVGAMPEPFEDEPEDVVLARLGLPDPDTLGAGDDFSGFMRAGVPDLIRKRALRRLWRSNPVLANVDGLNDYDEDFNSPEETLKILKTAYQVGRGFLRPEPESTDSETDSASVVDETTDDAVAAGAETHEDAPHAAPEGTGHPAPTEAPAEAREPAPARPQRMRFRT